MLLSHIEVCFQGSVLAFQDIPSFAAWVNSVEGTSKVIGIRGVGARHGHGDPLLSHFVTLDLHIEGPPGCWRRRCIGYLQKRCGHRLAEGEAVKRTEEKARGMGEVFRPVEKEVRRVTPSNGDVSLQEAPPTAVTSEAEGYISGPRAREIDSVHRSSRLKISSLFSLSSSIQRFLPLSAHDGSATSLSSLEREAIRTRGRPWDYRGADWGNLKQYYPVWITWQRMTKERKGLRCTQTGILRAASSLLSCCI